MAIEKVAVLAVGPANIRSNSATSRIFSSNIQMDNWSSAVSYNVQDCVEYGGNVWRASANNTNQIPVSGSTYWAIQYAGVHDGDIAISVTGIVDMRQRISGSWISISGRPKAIDLNDNQLVATEIFRYAAGSFKDAFIEYEIARGNGNTEGGTLRILTDGTSAFNYSQDFTWLLGDPQVTLSIAINAGDIVVSYTSALQTSPVHFKYSLRAW